MGVSFEDVAAVEALHRGVIPPTANSPSVDPALVRGEGRKERDLYVCILTDGWRYRRSTRALGWLGGCFNDARGACSVVPVFVHLSPRFSERPTSRREGGLCSPSALLRIDQQLFLIPPAVVSPAYGPARRGNFA